MKKMKKSPNQCLIYIEAEAFSVYFAISDARYTICDERYAMSGTYNEIRDKKSALHVTSSKSCFIRYKISKRYSVYVSGTLTR